MLRILFTYWAITLQAFYFMFNPVMSSLLTKIYTKQIATRLEITWPNLRLYGRNYVFVGEFRLN